MRKCKRKLLYPIGTDSFADKGDSTKHFHASRVRSKKQQSAKKQSRKGGID